MKGTKKNTGHTGMLNKELYIQILVSIMEVEGPPEQSIIPSMYWRRI